VLGAGIISGGVHRPVSDNAPSSAVQCHRRVFPEAGCFVFKQRGITAKGTAALCSVHRPINPERKTGSSTVRGTATPGWCTAPACLVPGLQRLVEIAVAIRPLGHHHPLSGAHTLLSDALTESAALLQRLYLVCGARAFGWLSILETECP
jgi:hypothetical protein